MSHNLEILIIEDELLIAEMLQETLFDLGHEVVGIATNFDEAIDLLSTKSNINFVFLDINLIGNQTGFTVAERINKDFKKPFVFLTSYSEAATIQQAAGFLPQGYLIKPFTKSELFVSLELYKAKFFDEGKSVEVKDGHFILKLKHIDILWIKSDNIYIEIQTFEKLHVIRTSIDKFLEKIDNKDFIRIHRSYAVNINHIKAVNRFHIVIENKKLPISRMHHDALLAKFSK